MKVEVDVISKEMIKPSSPTPDHLRHYQFSFLDQIMPSFYSYLLIFYQFNKEMQLNITEISNRLKESLAEVLTLYYPLAGRQSKDNMHIDCNDQGVPFLEAHVTNCQLSDILRNPIPGELNKLAPFELEDDSNNIPFGVQLSVFKCGGFAISQCISHKLADGLSLVMFSQAWSATARHAKVVPPQFVSATLFPPQQFSQVSIGVNKKPAKRFVFDASNINKLRENYEKYVGIEQNQKIMITNPSRIEIISAFISSRFAAVTNDADVPHGHEKLHSTIVQVNMRPRFDPPLPVHSFGNLVSNEGTPPSSMNTEEECYGLVKQIREAIKNIDKDHIKILQQGADHWRNGCFTGGEVVTSLYTNVTRFPTYENDFGWGEPSWVSAGLPGTDFNVVVMFMATKEDDGIEAYIYSSEENLTKLASDKEFHQHVCPIMIDPSSSSKHFLTSRI